MRAFRRNAVRNWIGTMTDHDIIKRHIRETRMFYAMLPALLFIAALVAAALPE